VPDQSQSFTDLAVAAYCPRQLYYARRADDRSPPASVGRVRDLAFRYPELRDADDATLASSPIDRSPADYRAALDALASRDEWPELADPTARDVYLTGKDCHGVAHKLLADGDGPPTPTLVSPGEPPDRGVWEPQRVRAVAAAKALSWERGATVERTLVEYPAHGVVRTVRATTRNRAAYRKALRVAETLDGPPPRLRDREKCESCAYREQCGVTTRSLRSLLGLG
jgi:CRISPR-associated exonuclease Cas4